MNDDEMALIDQAHDEYVKSTTVVTRSAEAVARGYDIVRFRGRAMLMVDEPYPHYKPLHKERFEQLAYPVLGGVSRSRMNDVFAYVCNTAEDLSEYEDYILFGLSVPQGITHPELNNYDAEFNEKNRAYVWDMKSLKAGLTMDADRCIWRSPYPPIKEQAADDAKPLEFVLQLAGGDLDLYDDIMQSIAPLIMRKKPDGVIWWVGDGANGKSTLMDALYRIFPNQLSSITVKRLVDGRDTPSLNGTLGNIVKESSEGRVDDTEVYKNIGTHENFRVHKFHSQDDIEIRGNLHHIFSANLIPAFNDKGYAARRRTFVIPFTERFKSDPTFEEKTFTPEFFGRLIQEMCKYALRLKKQGYRYKWSAKTLAAKSGYDAEASNAEEYAKYIIKQGVVGFNSFNPVRMDYENWCGDEGYVPLGVGNLRRALQACGFERMTVREGEDTNKHYRLPAFKSHELVQISSDRPGLFTIDDFRPVKSEAPKEPDAPEPPKQSSILNNKW